MVENNDLKSENTMNSANVKLITNEKKLLEKTTLSIQEEIRSSFEHLISVLKSREKQLLRQVEAVHVQQLSLIQSNLELVSCKPLLNIDLSSRYHLESQILDLGKLEVFGKNGISVKDTEPYKVQEYQEADKDHESFNKSIKLQEKDRPIELKRASDVNNLIFVENVDAILSCSCNSSLDSSVESENRSNRESSLLLNSNCTIIEKELFVSDNQSSRAKGKIDKELDLVDPNESLSLDLRNENSILDSCKVVDRSEELKESCLNKKEEYEEVVNSRFHKDMNANKEQNLSNLGNRNGQIRRDSAEHPKQIQQWLQQILVETETEPMIHEIEQFSEISKARLSGQFPLET